MILEILNRKTGEEELQQARSIRYKDVNTATLSFTDESDYEEPLDYAEALELALEKDVRSSLPGIGKDVRIDWYLDDSEGLSACEIAQKGDLFAIAMDNEAILVFEITEARNLMYDVYILNDQGKTLKKLIHNGQRAYFGHPVQA